MSFNNLNKKSKFLYKKKVIKYKRKDLHNEKKNNIILMVQFNKTFRKIIITFLRL
jgi:hypothetical protein